MHTKRYARRLVLLEHDVSRETIISRAIEAICIGVGEKIDSFGSRSINGRESLGRGERRRMKGKKGTRRQKNEKSGGL